MLVYSEYPVGGACDLNNDGLAEVVVGADADADGNIYLGGYTHSLDFPVTKGAVQPTSAGAADLFSAAGDYPSPIVDHTFARERALAFFKAD